MHDFVLCTTISPAPTHCWDRNKNPVNIFLNDLLKFANAIVSFSKAFPNYLKIFAHYQKGDQMKKGG